MSRDLPIPGSPQSSTTWPSPPLALAQRFFPSDQGRQAGRMQSLEAAFHGSWPQHRPGAYWPSDPFEFVCPEVCKFEEIAEKLSRTFCDHDRVRLGESLQARSEIRRLADNAALWRVPRSHQVANHNLPGRNAHTGFGLRIAKIHEDAVA